MSIIDLRKLFGGPPDAVEVVDKLKTLATGDLAEGVFLLYDSHVLLLDDVEEDENVQLGEDVSQQAIRLSESVCMLGCLTIEMTLKSILREKGIVEYAGEYKHSIFLLLEALRDNPETRAIFTDLRKYVVHNRGQLKRLAKKSVFTMANICLRSFEAQFRYQDIDLESTNICPDASVVLIFLKFFKIAGYLKYIERRVVDAKYIKVEDVSDYPKSNRGKK